MAFNQLGVGFGNSLDITQLDPAAALDVAGAMRIRKGCLPSGVDCTNKVLTADANGTAGWADLPPPLSGLSPGFAVIINQSGSISQIAFQGVQARITGTCTGNNYSAITAISGTTGTTSCLALVSSITASAAGGLTGGGQGAVSLGVNAGSGLTINGNKLVINPPAADFGLTVSGNFLKFSSAGCTGNNVYWKYDTTTGWSCGGPVLVNRPPGESVMYLKARSPGDPPACPDTVFDTGLWTDLGVTAEFVSATVSVKHNVRTCVKSAPAIKPICQTMYLKSASPTSPPSCPSGWLTTGTQTTEYASGDSNYLNNVRTCFKCN
ncbi:MAG: hypothetical protein HYT46_00410 [Candidatus Vogelbacteria bacterium]|nr:hypothetical protein [Candidatus Vogelbacteria bacterium]